MDIAAEESLWAIFLSQSSFFQLFGFLLAIIGWCLCISSTSSVQWRIWHVENRPELQSSTLWIGIWDVCYEAAPHDPDEEEIITVCKSFGSDHDFLPREIFIAQDLMSLCSVVEALALSFFFFAYWNILKNENKKKITVTFFPVGGFLVLMAGVVVLIPLTWNTLSVLSNAKIIFPESFDIPYHPKKQSVGVGIHFGFASAVLQIVSGLIFLGNKFCIIHKKVHPIGFAEGFETSNKNDLEHCSRCGSSLDIVVSGTHLGKDSRNNKLRAKPEVTFQVPEDNEAFVVPNEPQRSETHFHIESDLDQNNTNTTAMEYI